MIAWRSSCYLITGVQTQWSAALDYCQNLGYELVTVTSLEENTFVNKIRRDAGKENVWVGLFFISQHVKPSSKFGESLKFLALLFPKI
jgi:hypothetical protein